MLRCTREVVLIGSLWLSSAWTMLAVGKLSGQENKLDQFHGQWSTSREVKKEGKLRRFELVLDFRGVELAFHTEEGGKKEKQFTLKVIGVEEGKDARSMVLAHSESRYVIYYDFQSERLILVGRLLNRPFEGFSLSGEYKRVEKPK